MCPWEAMVKQAPWSPQPGGHSTDHRPEAPSAWTASSGNGSALFFFCLNTPSSPSGSRFTPEFSVGDPPAATSTPGPQPWFLDTLPNQRDKRENDRKEGLQQHTRLNTGKEPAESGTVSHDPKGKHLEFKKKKDS